MSSTPSNIPITDADSAESSSGEESDIYEVKEILAEYFSFVDSKLTRLYLVSWAGYPLTEATWEPREAFSSPETIESWEVKKELIQRGEQPAFDVELYVNAIDQAFGSSTHQKKEDTISSASNKITESIRLGLERRIGGSAESPLLGLTEKGYSTFKKTSPTAASDQTTTIYQDTPHGGAKRHLPDNRRDSSSSQILSPKPSQTVVDNTETRRNSLSGTQVSPAAKFGPSKIVLSSSRSKGSRTSSILRSARRGTLQLLPKDDLSKKRGFVPGNRILSNWTKAPKTRKTGKSDAEAPGRLFHSMSAVWRAEKYARREIAPRLEDLELFSPRSVQSVMSRKAASNQVIQNNEKDISEPMQGNADRNSAHYHPRSDDHFRDRSNTERGNISDISLHLRKKSRNEVAPLRTGKNDRRTTLSNADPSSALTTTAAEGTGSSIIDQKFPQTSPDFHDTLPSGVTPSAGREIGQVVESHFPNERHSTDAVITRTSERSMTAAEMAPTVTKIKYVTGSVDGGSHVPEPEQMENQNPLFLPTNSPPPHHIMSSPEDAVFEGFDAPREWGLVNHSYRSNSQWIPKEAPVSSTGSAAMSIDSISEDDYDPELALSNSKSTSAPGGSNMVSLAEQTFSGIEAQISVEIKSTELRTSLGSVKLHSSKELHLKTLFEKLKVSAGIEPSAILFNRAILAFALDLNVLRKKGGNRARCILIATGGIQLMSQEDGPQQAANHLEIIMRKTLTGFVALENRYAFLMYPAGTAGWARIDDSSLFANKCVLRFAVLSSPKLPVRKLISIKQSGDGIDAPPILFKYPLRLDIFHALFGIDFDDFLRALTISDHGKLFVLLCYPDDYKAEENFVADYLKVRSPYQLRLLTFNENCWNEWKASVGAGVVLSKAQPEFSGWKDMPGLQEHLKNDNISYFHLGTHRKMLVSQNETDIDSRWIFDCQPIFPRKGCTIMLSKSIAVHEPKWLVTFLEELREVETRFPRLWQLYCPPDFKTMTLRLAVESGECEGPEVQKCRAKVLKILNDLCPDRAFTRFVRSDGRGKLCHYRQPTSHHVVYWDYHKPGLEEHDYKAGMMMQDFWQWCVRVRKSLSRTFVVLVGREELPQTIERWRAEYPMFEIHTTESFQGRLQELKTALGLLPPMPQ